MLPRSSHVALLIAGVLLVLHALAGVASAAAPVNTAIPGVTGEYRVGQMLTGVRGTWTPTTGLQYTETWERCDADGANCEPIAGISGSKYLLAPADLNRTVRFNVRASNVDGETYAVSAATPVIADRQPPVLDPGTPPTVSGLAFEGQTLTATTGGWSGPPTIKPTAKWQRCDVALTLCTTLTATGLTYKLVPADIDSVLRVEVTATNPDGSTVAYSAPSAQVQGVAPENTEPPTISGPARDGQVQKLLSAGKWTGTQPFTTTYQWERCDALGGACNPIADALASSYTAAAVDIGSTLRLVVTQRNVTNVSASAASAPSPVIAPKDPPAQTALGTISGTAVDGQKLTATDGTWTGVEKIGYARVWQRCSSTGTSCVDLTTTTASYTLTAADVGSTVRTKITATNDDGSNTGYTELSTIVAAAPPTLKTLPVVTGTARDGQVLSSTSGAFNGTAPITTDFQWLRCVGEACATIPGATSPTYRLTSDDIGTQIRSEVTAWNGGGTLTVQSAATAAVTAGAPVNTALPVITGDQPRDGVLYSSSTGSWAGTDTWTYEYQWQRCSNTGASCVAISGAIADTYRLQSADVGRTIRLEVTAISAHGSGKAASAASAVILAARPEVDGALTVGGTLRDGQTVSADATWKGTLPITFTYAWQRCTLTCVDITGATAATYKLTPADVGARMKVRVGATGPGGGGAAESAESAVVLADPPARTGDPVLSGTARSGATLTTTLAAFTGTPPLDRTVQWERCAVDGTACAPIAGATGTSYVLTEGDRGGTIRAVVTATNGGGTATATSALSAVVAAAPPTNTIVPAVTPNTGLRDGAQLSSTTGTWAGSSPMTYAIRWQRCGINGANCADIPSATGSTYTATTADVDFTLRSVVTATNGAGNESIASLVTGVVGTNPPTNDILPTLEGETNDGTLAPNEVVDGKTLRATLGTWSGLVPMTPTYEWWRCNAAGESCAVIAGATGSTYRLAHEDVGLSVRARVIQTSAGGSTGVFTASSGAVDGAPPARVTSPQVIGGAAVGKTVTAAPGTWNGTPELRYAYQWQSCDLDSANCVDIPGAAASTYTITEGDAARTLRVIVTAENDYGTDTATSPTTREVLDDPPIMVTGPAISTPGLVAHGAVLHADPGVWSGADPIEFTYQWRRCDVALAACVPIAGATGQDYLLTKDDVAKRIVLVVTAENIVDVASAQTPASATVLPEPPTNSTLPVISATGGVKDGAKLTATNGMWTGATPITYAVTWVRCTAAGTGCVPVTETPSASYTLTSEDVGSRIRARVTAKNSASEVSIDSNATAIVAPASPASKVKPAAIVLDGKPAVGARVRAAEGTFTGTNPMDVSLQWQRCVGSSLAACEDIPGATGIDYVLTEGDVGAKVRVVVTARNAGGTAVAESAVTAAVPAIEPRSTDVPRIDGAPVREGVPLRAWPGTWSGSTPMTIGYQWERCKEAGSTSCPKISGATSETYTPVSADVGQSIRVTVTAVNAGGKVSRSSVPTRAVEGVAPFVLTAPTASAKGTVKVGTTLTATAGKWGGTAPIKTTVQWQRCDSRGRVCEDVEKATRTTYRLTADDIDGTLLRRPMRVLVTATNVAGTGEAASALLGAPVEVPTTVGAAGETAVGAKAGRGAGSTYASTGKSLARIKKVRFTPKGRLLVTLTCPKESTTSCGAAGRFRWGTLSFKIDAGPIKKGRGLNVGWKLSPKQRRRLKGRSRILLKARFAAPSKRRIVRSQRVGVKVPKKISGKARKAKKKNRKLTAKQRAAAKRRAVARKKKASVKKKARSLAAAPGGKTAEAPDAAKGSSAAGAAGGSAAP